MTDLMTIGDIARKLGVARTRLEYAVEKAGIQERGRAGILRLFSPDQVPVIEAALATVRSRRPKTGEAEGVGPCPR
jgi:DNA-binding transcriptional MerR regulator